MVSRRRGGAMFAQNGIALVGNVGLNLWLLPRVGIIASAWTTVATEVFVCGCAWYSLRRVIRARQLFAGCVRPVLALLAIGAVAMLPMSRLLALIVAILVFPVVMTALRAWPPELTARRRRAVGAAA
jgi:O-antigen/teichoic acid export membrane protein